MKLHAASFYLMAALSAAPAIAADPPVPIGQDPGGIAVALISAGIDYTDPAVANCLARDGEGELIGWDFVDNDRRPYAAGSNKLPTLGPDFGGQVRIVPVRVDPARPISLAQAVAFISKTPAQSAVLEIASLKRADWEPFRQAMLHFKEVTIFVSACAAPKDADVPGDAEGPVLPQSLGLPNVIAAPCMK